MEANGKAEVFVIGGSGFIGSAIARAFARQGYRVVVSCHSQAGARQLAGQGFGAVQADIALPGAWLDHAVKADIVVYAAQERAGQRLDAAWLERSRATRDASLALLWPALMRGQKRPLFLHTSAIAVLGDHGEAQVDETTARKPSPIGDFHAAGEALVQEAGRRGLSVVILRPGFVYGPGGAFAEFFIKPARQRFYPFPGDGRNFLPWVHVDDVAEAYVRAAEKSPAGQVLHVVGDDPIRLHDFGKLLVKQAGGGRTMGMPKFVVSMLAGGPLVAMLGGSYRASNRRARTVLDWQPRYGRIEDGLAATFASYDAGTVGK